VKIFLQRYTFPELKLSILDFVCAKYCPIWSTFSKVIAEIKMVYFLWSTVYIQHRAVMK